MHFIHGLLEINLRMIRDMPKGQSCILCDIEKGYLGPKSKKNSMNLMVENGLIDKLKHGVGVEGEGA